MVNIVYSYVLVDYAIKKGKTYAGFIITRVVILKHQQFYSNRTEFYPN